MMVVLIQGLLATIVVQSLYVKECELFERATQGILAGRSDRRGDCCDANNARHAYRYIGH